MVPDYRREKEKIMTQGISPYFLDTEQIIAILNTALVPKLKEIAVDEIYFYGTGLSNENNVLILKTALKKYLRNQK